MIIRIVFNNDGAFNASHYIPNQDIVIGQFIISMDRHPYFIARNQPTNLLESLAH